MDHLSWVVVLLVGLIIGGTAGLALGRRLAGASRRAPLVQPADALADPDRLERDKLGAQLLDQVRTAAAVVDGSGAVVLANPAARRLGVVSGDALEPSLRDLVRETRRRPGERTWAARLSGAGRRSGLTQAPGREVSVQASLLPGGFVAVLVEDVTEAHRVESVRRDFIANVSHEIKTPVGALALLAEAALEADDDPVAMHRFVARIRFEAVRLGRLVGELIDLSRLQGGEAPPSPIPVPLDRVVQEAADRGRLAAEARGISIISGGDPGGVVLGSEAQLVTAVANLVDNAVNYSDHGTRVAIATRDRGEHWEVSVTDQGIGIPEADTGRIFERFYRVDPARSRQTGGTGLGLAIVKHIVTNHGGEVGVWSVPGNGSTFTLRLPSAAARRDDATATAAVAAGPSRKQAP